MRHIYIPSRLANSNLNTIRPDGLSTLSNNLIADTRINARLTKIVHARPEQVAQHNSIYLSCIGKMCSLTLAFYTSLYFGWCTGTLFQ